MIKRLMHSCFLKCKKFGISHNLIKRINKSAGFNGFWTELEDKQIIVSDNEQQCFAADRNLSIVQNGDVYTCFQQNWINDCQKPLGNLHIDEMSEVLSSHYTIFVSKKNAHLNFIL